MDLLCYVFSIFLGLVISFSFSAGCAIVIVALQHKQTLSVKLQKISEYLGLRQGPKKQPIDCDVCGIVKCNRHISAPNREPWRGLFITRELNDALDSVNDIIFCQSNICHVFH